MPSEGLFWKGLSGRCARSTGLGLEYEVRNGLAAAVVNISNPKPMRSPDELLLLELSTGYIPLHPHPPMLAFFIAISAPAFVNTIAYEICHEYQAIVLTKDTVSWPYYFRDKRACERRTRTFTSRAVPRLEIKRDYQSRRFLPELMHSGSVQHKFDKPQLSQRAITGMWIAPQLNGCYMRF